MSVARGSSIPAREVDGRTSASGKRWRLSRAVAAAWLGLAAAALPDPARPATDPDPRRSEVVVLDEERLRTAVSLVKEWRYRPGDDPSWADPALDDAEWALVSPALKSLEEIPGGWPGIGWFRRRILATPGYGRAPLGLHITQAGASEVYLDGDLVAEFGRVSTSPARERAMMPEYVVSLTLEPGVEHVLAVRYSNVAGNVLPGDLRGFEVHLGETRILTEAGVRQIRQCVAFSAGAIGLFGVLTLLHLLLFVFQPRAVENLYFALFTGSMVAVQLAEMRMNSLSELAEALVYYKVLLTFGLVMALAAVLLELKILKQRAGWIFYGLGLGALALLVWVWRMPAFVDLTPLNIFLILAFLEALRLAVLALVRREPDAWIIGVGFLVLTVTFIVGSLQNLGIVTVPALAVAALGLGSLAVSFSIYLTRRVARTNRELAARLDEVHELTARAVVQERRAAREEAERRLLEADNQRKTAELEEARELQLAMLPRELPRLGGFEVAVRMTTANEVGGDYYDFAADGNGACTLAVGDAIGHGLQAGMVVAVAKSLFQTAWREARLAKVLQRIDAGLGTIQQRAASMAMVLVRLEERRLRVASAGMPPLLVWRQATGELEELLLPGPPLGTVLVHGDFREREVALAPGDAVLIMTDGLAEATDPDGESLGYDQAGRLFAEVAELEPEAIIDHLVRQARLYLGDTPLGDDMTLLVLKASGAPA